MKFWPMCSEKIPSETAKFYNDCSLNLTEYQKKLERLTSPTTTPATVPPYPRVDEPQKYDTFAFRAIWLLTSFVLQRSRRKNSTKIQFAVKAYAHETANENIIFVLDDTLFGDGEDGFLVTTENIYGHNMGEKTFVVSWHEVQTFTPTVKKLNQRIAINGGREICLSGYSQGELNALVELLKAIKANRDGQTFVAPKKLRRRVKKLGKMSSQPRNLPTILRLLRSLLRHRKMILAELT